MLLVGNRFLVLRNLQIWWPENDEDVRSVLPHAPVVTVMQCGDHVARALGPYAFRIRPFYTSIVDLCLSEQELWSNLDGQSCRYKIGKAKRLGCTVSVHEDPEQAFRFVNHFIERRRFRRRISGEEWRQYLEHGELCCVRHEGKLAAVHLNLVDRPRRSRLLFSATAPPGDGVPSTALGVANRLLHWEELIRYKREGIACYDFGGIAPDTRSPQYSISQFKSSFGGRLVRSSIMRLASDRALRLALRELAQAKVLLQRESTASVPLMRASADRIAASAGAPPDPTRRTR
jgi:GNAT acetyltransferase-like protein